jgi:LPXTG-motif cell wall-anchored protein
MKRVIVFLAALPLLAFSSLASALTCDDISLSPEITDKYPNAQEACLEVVERNGEQFVKMRVELTRQGEANKLTFRFTNEDGSFGPTHAVNPPPEWRANIAGSNYRARDLGKGQELSIYLPPDRWEAHVAAPNMVVETFSLIVITAAEPEPMMLPSTASNMPLFALFGGLALFGAGLIRVTRRQAG